MTEFTKRHIGIHPDDRAKMLKALGYDSLDNLIRAAMPNSIFDQALPILPPTMSEEKMLRELSIIARKNKRAANYLGQGYYATVTPPVIQRNILENPGWYTAYTPYQAEISQGRLEALLNFQQMVIDLTGLAVANAALLDEGTAVAEAAIMAKRVSKKAGANKILVERNLFTQSLAVLETRAGGLGLDLEIVPREQLYNHFNDDVFVVIMQNPDDDGRVEDLTALIGHAHEKNILTVVACDILSLVLTKSPGAMGADIAVGSTQRFGVPMGFGGPHAAFFACRDEYKRQIPGRIIGVSKDKHGRPALRMAMQTREQHIRREKATSNICTSQVLLAVIAGFFAIYHGPEGLRDIALRVHRKAAALMEALGLCGYGIPAYDFFDSLKLKITGRAEEIVARAKQANVNIRLYDKDHIGIAIDEVINENDLLELICAITDLKEIEAANLLLKALSRNQAYPQHLARTDDILTHPHFHKYRTETELLRYIRRLQIRDIALDRSMIPLGSCTMKLNAAAEMIPISWPEFAWLHPFAPRDHVIGYRQLISDLEQYLCVLTGYDAVSLMPNAGSQGEYAGLLAIKRYFASIGQSQRNICLIPDSAHGTNPASATLAGFEVVVVACTENGLIDETDLDAKLAAAGDKLGAIMVTYPSTYGVFDEGIDLLCQKIHDHGGQVYVDGANLNALVGICRPGNFGADVSHLNLHKTFCIPHGGGGPGVGPIGVKSHLAPFLPGHPMDLEANPYALQGEAAVGAVSSAPYGSASILPISWAYIRMMGPSGLRLATQCAILSANYVAMRLKDHYPVRFTGRNDLVAHECVLDCRDFKEATGITVEDIAKRLADYGFHAPTMSWPAADSLMVEPTESESLEELDRFCDAMISIRAEIKMVEDGKWPKDNNPLTNAPHSQILLLEEWEFPYERQVAFFPNPAQVSDKYWPPVGRVDNVYGDRNLMCACPPLDAWKTDGE